jgi:hypothetical protein
LGEAEQEGQVAVQPLALQDLRRSDAFPCRGDLEEDPGARVDAGGLVELHQRRSAFECGFGVERKPRIDLGRDPSGNDLQDLRAEVDGELVHGRLGLVHRVAAAFTRAEEDGVLDQLAILRHLSRFEDQGGVGGGILGLVLGDGLEVAGVGDDRGHGLELVELAHGSAPFEG